MPSRRKRIMDSTAPGTILFVCTGNSCRSPMAEAIARTLVVETTPVLSAGVRPGSPVQHTARVLAEIGIDLKDHLPRSVFEIDPEPVAVVVTLSKAARERCPAFPNEIRRDHWDIPDPFEVRGSEAERLSAYREARDRIGMRVRDLLRELGWPIPE